MDGENNGKPENPYEHGMIWVFVPYIFGSTPIYSTYFHPNSLT